LHCPDVHLDVLQAFIVAMVLFLEVQVEAHALTLLLGSYFYWLRTTIQII
jgi:hypothetical protein